MKAQQDDRRQALVEAAAEVLRTRGLAACTARAIADASPLTKSALHYYFEDTDEIIDLAFRALMDQFFDRLLLAAAGAPAPDEALWATARAYLHLGADRPGDRPGRRIPMLWFEMQVAASRTGNLDTLTSISNRVLQLFVNLVADTGVPDAAARGSALVSALIGTVVRADMGIADLDRELCAIAVAFGLRPPVPASTARS